MLENIDMVDVLLGYLCLLFSLCFHEAAHAAMANNENSLYNGGGGDFFLYRHPGRKQFILIPWDLDSVIDSEKAPTKNPLFPGGNAPINKFRQHPQVRSRYIQRTLEILEHQMNPKVMNKRLDKAGSAISASYRAKLQRDIAARAKFIADSYLKKQE